LKRKWLSFELDANYVANSALRFLNGQSEHDIKHIYQKIIRGEFVDLSVVHKTTIPLILKTAETQANFTVDSVF
jgi:hypothetical protein